MREIDDKLRAQVVRQLAYSPFVVAGREYAKPDHLNQWLLSVADMMDPVFTDPATAILGDEWHVDLVSEPGASIRRYVRVRSGWRSVRPNLYDDDYLRSISARPTP